MAKISFYLDRRRPRKDGLAQLKMAVNHLGKTCYIPTGLYYDPHRWSDNPPEPISTDRHVLKSFNSARLMLLRATDVMLDCSASAEPFTAQTLRDRITNALFPDKAAPKSKEEPKGIKWCFSEFIAQKTGRTRELYEITLKRIREFSPAGETALSDIGKDWLSKFDAHLSRNSPNLNARSIHLRNIRAVFNWAIDEGLTDNYPFRRFKIRSQPTLKRAFSAEALRKILTADLTEKWFEHYRDFFALSFYLIGMNTVDLCRLTAISPDGRIDYIRAKTHKPYSVKVEPEALEIIKRNLGDRHLFRDLDGYKSYRTYANLLCAGLETLRKHLNGIDDGIFLPNITTYWARHSWATIAASLDIPKETIAAALGHGGNTVTDIYINFDQGKVDIANRRVIDWVLYGKR